MKRKINIILINVGLLFFMVAFNNCGQPGELRMESLPAETPTDSSTNDNFDTGGDEPEPANPPDDLDARFTKVEKTVTLAETFKADILFVVDNSLSMEDEQSHMSERFPLFIKNLKQINWRVGVITTDVDDPDQSYADGKLQSVGNGSKYLDSKVPEADAERLFAKTIHRKESGSPYEQGIYATYRFLEREASAVAPFMRADASLNIVFLADADETPYSSLLTGESVVKKRNKPDELLKYLKANWPMKNFQFHSIVVNEGDKACLAQSDNESYGLAYEYLSGKTNGVKGSVCAADYGNQLLFLSEKIKDLVKTMTLDCAPVYDPVAEKYRFAIKYQGAETIEVDRIDGKTVYFKGGLPTGEIKLTYFCSSEMLSN